MKEFAAFTGNVFLDNVVRAFYTGNTRVYKSFRPFLNHRRQSREPEFIHGCHHPYNVVLTKSAPSESSK